MASNITARDLSGMLGHWLRTPVNGYLGSGYGSDLKSLLHTPTASGLADGVIAKARQDIPLLLTAPDDMVNIYAQDLGMDHKGIVFEVAGELVPVDGSDIAPLPDAAIVEVQTKLEAEANAQSAATAPGYF